MSNGIIVDTIFPGCCSRLAHQSQSSQRRGRHPPSLCSRLLTAAGFACLFMWCFHGRTLDVIAMSCDKDTTRGFVPLVPRHLKVDFQAINGLKKPLKLTSNGFNTEKQPHEIV